MRRPNILLITSDQQHYSMLGCQNAKLKTPNLDSLAAEGMLFDRAYCTNPTCSPSRSSILTGMYPSHHGCWSLGTKLPEDVPTLPGILRQNGYKTALIGKAHFQPTASTPQYPSLETLEKGQDFAFWRQFHDVFYGFDHIELLRNHTAEHWVGHHYAMWMEENGFKEWRKYFFRPTGRMRQKAMGKWKIPEKYHYNTWIAQRACAQLDAYKKDGSPFFLWASFPDPHYPQLVPAPWDKMYSPSDMELDPFSFKEHEKNPPYFREVFKPFPNFKPYRESGYGIHGLYRHLYRPKELKRQLAYAWGMVSFMDKYIGKILDRLKALEMDENTIVIFTTDHGDLFGQHGFRHKCLFHYEDLLRVPLIVRYKGFTPPGVRSDALQSLCDLAPTLLHRCGIEIPPQMQGFDQSAVWSGKEAPARPWAVCENRHEPHTLDLRTYIEPRYKITVHEGHAYGELYDLQSDPKEHRNLWDEADKLPLKAEMLCRFLKAELQKNGEKETGFTDGGYTLRIAADGADANDGLFQTESRENMWQNPACLQIKTRLLLACLNDRLKNEPIPMPRIASS